MHAHACLATTTHPPAHPLLPHVTPPRTGTFHQRRTTTRKASIICVHFFVVVRRSLFVVRCSLFVVRCSNFCKLSNVQTFNRQRTANRQQRFLARARARTHEGDVDVDVDIDDATATAAAAFAVLTLWFVSFVCCCWLVGWLVGWLVRCWSAVGSFRWFVGPFVDWFVGWLDHSARCSFFVVDSSSAVEEFVVFNCAVDRCRSFVPMISQDIWRSLDVRPPETNSSVRELTHCRNESQQPRQARCRCPLT